MKYQSKGLWEKNGQSIYKINNQTQTRQDVLALLAQAGIDPNGFNIILQGEIQNFVAMGGEDRRKVIEEVAGISIYEMRKEKSLKELESKSNDDDAEYNTSPYPKSERDINLSIIYSKLKFYFKNKISIKFRLIERLEYQFEGKLIEVERNKFTIQLEKDKAIFRCLDVDHTTICPKSYDPFMKGIRIEIPEELRERIFKRDNYTCQCCSKEADI